MQTETEHFTDEEYLTDLEDGIENAPSLEDEGQETFEYDQEENAETAELQVFIESGHQAVLEQKGGDAEDWQLEYRGDSGYRFDGRDIRDPSGAIWANEDASLHQEMLSQWREGGSGVFFLPDHREQTDNGEVLYVTQLILDEGGGVTYEIHKHEMTHGEEEALVPEAEAYTALQAEPRPDQTEELSGESGAERAHESEEKSLEETRLAEADSTERSVVETSATPDTWLAEILDDGPLEVEQGTRANLATPSIPSTTPAPGQLPTPTDSTEAEPLLAHTEDEPTPRPQGAEAILHAVGMPMLSPRVARSPDLPTPGSVSSAPRSSVMSQHESHVENAHPRSPLRSRVSKDGITLHMAT